MWVQAVLIGCLIVFIVTFAVNAYFRIRFLTRLKGMKPDKWVALDQPMPGVNFDTSNFAKVQEFLRLRKHHELHDPTLAALGDQVRRTDRVLLAVIFVIPVVVLLLLKYA